MSEQPKPQPPRQQYQPAALRIVYCCDCNWLHWEHDIRFLASMWNQHADRTGCVAYRWDQ